MRVLLTAINAKYIHSNLAVYSLQKSAGMYADQVELAEYTINHTAEQIFAGIYRRKPEILFFSCYIWNRREVIEAAESLHRVLPDTVIWAGGPEVSYDAAAFLREHTAFTGVMVGEGERTFRQLLASYLDGIGSPEDLPGIALREENGQVRQNAPVTMMTSLDELPFVYEDLTGFENRIIYYESSRGCPFSCSYCLSSIDKRVRYRSLDLVTKELQFFLDHRVKQVKFVDRTFNCRHDRTMAIWQYIKDHDNGCTNFHFEISADLLNAEEIKLLNSLRPGQVQLEIGVQTLHPGALEAIHRTAPFAQIAESVNLVDRAHNIHQHLDLIAGLPYEDLQHFRDSFDGVYALHPQELQLGFLKVLRGSEMYLRAEEYGIIYRSEPPYEVLSTRWISCDELLHLKDVEEMLEVYYNSRQFDSTIFALEKLFARPIEMYEALADFYEEKDLYGKAYSRLQRFEILHCFLAEGPKKEQTCLPYFEALLMKDLYLRENAKKRPEWASELKKDQDMTAAFFRAEEKYHRYLPDHTDRTWKQMMHMTHLERFAYTGDGERQECWLLFDYARRDPLTGSACLQEISRAELSAYAAMQSV